MEETPGSQEYEDRPQPPGQGAQAPAAAAPTPPPPPPPDGGDGGDGGDGNGNGNGSGTLQTVLDALNKALQKASQEAARSQEESKALDADVKALAAAYATVGKAVEAYGKNRPSLEQQRGAQKDYIDKQEDLILGAIDDRREEVDGVWGDVEKQIDHLGTQLDRDRATLVEKSRGYEDKQQAAQDAQAALDEVNNRQAIVNAWLQQLAP